MLLGEKMVCPFSPPGRQPLNGRATNLNLNLIECSLTSRIAPYISVLWRHPRQLGYPSTPPVKKGAETIS
jgi:hypothetical protein